MVTGKQVTTRVSLDVYKKVLQKCADGGCSPYEYFRQLVRADVADHVQDPVEEPVEDPAQTKIPELLKENERVEGRINVVG